MKLKVTLKKVFQGPRLFHSQSDFLNPVGQSEKSETLKPETKNLKLPSDFPQGTAWRNCLAGITKSVKLYFIMLLGVQKVCRNCDITNLMETLKNNNQTNIQNIFKLTPALSRFPQLLLATHRKKTSQEVIPGRLTMFCKTNAKNKYVLRPYLKKKLIISFENYVRFSLSIKQVTLFTVATDQVGLYKQCFFF